MCCDTHRSILTYHNMREKNFKFITGKKISARANRFSSTCPDKDPVLDWWRKKNNFIENWTEFGYNHPSKSKAWSGELSKMSTMKSYFSSMDWWKIGHECNQWSIQTQAWKMNILSSNRARNRSDQCFKFWSDRSWRRQLDVDRS